MNLNAGGNDDGVMCLDDDGGLPSLIETAELSARACTTEAECLKLLPYSSSSGSSGSSPTLHHRHYPHFSLLILEPLGNGVQGGSGSTKWVTHADCAGAQWS